MCVCVCALYIKAYVYITHVLLPELACGWPAGRCSLYTKPLLLTAMRKIDTEDNVESDQILHQTM